MLKKDFLINLYLFLISCLFQLPPRELEGLTLNHTGKHFIKNSSDLHTVQYILPKTLV